MVLATCVVHGQPCLQLQVMLSFVFVEISVEHLPVFIPDSVPSFRLAKSELARQSSLTSLFLESLTLTQALFWFRPGQTQ